MTARLLRAAMGVAVWAFGLTALLYMLNVGQLRPVPGAQMVAELYLCETRDCEASTPQGLPFFSQMRFDVEPDVRHLRATLAQPDLPEGVQALYFPKFADNLAVRVNGQLLRDSGLPKRSWNTPILVPVPQPVAQTPTLVVDLTLSGPPSEGLDLQPFYYGPREVLAPYHAWRHFLGPGLARFALGLMGVLGTALLIVWGYRRQEGEYLWLGLACLCAAPVLAQYGYGKSIGGDRLGTLLWVHCVSLYVLLVLMFLTRFLNLSLRWPERTHAVLFVVASLVVLLSPPGYAFFLSMWGATLITAPWAFSALVILWLNRGLLNALDMRVFFLCLSVAWVLGIYALYLHIFNAPARTMHLFHLMPLVMSLACIWLIVSRLIHSLRGYEALTASLNDTIARKSAELEASFSELADIRRREAIAEERDRIMLDLHDGIGGQLVSTLAYMQSNKVGDEKIRRALEEALRDLAVMLDSMENHDSLVTLLGMLRTRLEGLLSENGLEFDWQVRGEPVLATPGPSQSLHLARIVQEAITNVIKYAEADTITIFVDEAQIRISDNGQGFDIAAQAANEHPANGIANMRRRAESIGAAFGLTSGASGTDISLRFR